MGAGDGIVRKRVEHGAVWVTARVGGYLYDVAAPKPGAWGLPLWGGVQHGPSVISDGRALAVELVESWARDHASELDALFRQAHRQRRPATLRPPE